MRLAFLNVVAMACLAFTGCEREAREFRSAATAETASRLEPSTPYHAGLKVNDDVPVMKAADFEESHFERNAQSLSEGKWLYIHFNCYGCHGHGGGDMGPALIDANWRYGYRPEQILSSILQGRPNGMPAFASKLTKKQAWELVAYVRSMSGLAAGDAAPGRDDHMKTAPPESTIKNDPPRETGPPPIPQLRH